MNKIIVFTLNVFFGDLGKVAGQRSLVGELLQQQGKGGILPVGGQRLVGDGVKTDLLSVGIQFMDQRVVGVLVSGEEGGRHGAIVGILAVVQGLSVVRDVHGSHGVVEGQQDKLEFTNCTVIIGTTNFQQSHF